MSSDEKYLIYRANKISKAQGISFEDGMVLAKKEIINDINEQKKLKIEKHKARAKKVIKILKKNNKKTVYTVGPNVVTHMVSGGLPSLSKKN